MKFQDDESLVTRVLGHWNHAMGDVKPLRVISLLAGDPLSPYEKV